MSACRDIDRLSSALAERGALKLWSVIVTILGDMAEGGHTELPGPLLTAIVEDIGLQPQAMRVALHRLRKDGWVESRKAARVGYYGLSPRGLVETRAASARVYGPAARVEPCLVVVPPEVDMQGGIQLARQTWIVDERDVPADALSGGIRDDVPGWVRQQLAIAAFEDEFADLNTVFDTIKTLPDSPLGQVTLRTLVLHGWRRLVLKADPLAESVLGKGCAVAQCRERVSRLLEQLPRPEPAKLFETVH